MLQSLPVHWLSHLHFPKVWSYWPWPPQSGRQVRRASFLKEWELNWWKIYNVESSVTIPFLAVWSCPSQVAVTFGWDADSMSRTERIPTVAWGKECFLYGFWSRGVCRWYRYHVIIFNIFFTNSTSHQLSKDIRGIDIYKSQIYSFSSFLRFIPKTQIVRSCSNVPMS